MKIGIFGGSFNPVHNGHLIIAEFIRDYAKLDKVLFVPVGRPSHREDNLASSEHRVNMIKLAIEGNNYFDISDIELKHGNVCYTIDTLREIKKMYPNDEFFEIIGEDSADYIEKWKEYKELLELAVFYVFKRKGFDLKREYKNLEVVNTPIIEISSSDIRERIRNNKTIKYMVSEEVEKYICNNRLY